MLVQEEEKVYNLIGDATENNQDIEDVQEMDVSALKKEKKNVIYFATFCIHQLISKRKTKTEVKNYRRH